MQLKRSNGLSVSPGRL